MRASFRRLYAVALLTYAWQGFPHTPIIGSVGMVDLIGNAVFALGAVGLVATAFLALRRRRNSPIRNARAGGDEAASIPRCAFIGQSKPWVRAARSGALIRHTVGVG